MPLQPSPPSLAEPHTDLTFASRACPRVRQGPLRAEKKQLSEVGISPNATSSPIAFHLPCEQRRDKIRDKLRKSPVTVENHRMYERFGIETCSWPTSRCFRPQMELSFYCDVHTCHALLEDGTRCTTIVSSQHENKFCAAGYHEETNRGEMIYEMKLRRQYSEFIEVETRKINEQVQLGKTKQEEADSQLERLRSVPMDDPIVLRGSGLRSRSGPDSDSTSSTTDDAIRTPTAAERKWRQKDMEMLEQYFKNFNCYREEQQEKVRLELLAAGKPVETCYWC